MPEQPHSRGNNHTLARTSVHTYSAHLDPQVALELCVLFAQSVDLGLHPSPWLLLLLLRPADGRRALVRSSLRLSMPRSQPPRRGVPWPALRLLRRALGWGLGWVSHGLAPEGAQALLLSWLAPRTEPGGRRGVVGWVSISMRIPIDPGRDRGGGRWMPLSLPLPRCALPPSSWIAGLRGCRTCQGSTVGLPGKGLVVHVQAALPAVAAAVQHRACRGRQRRHWDREGLKHDRAEPQVLSTEPRKGNHGSY